MENRRNMRRHVLQRRSGTAPDQPTQAHQVPVTPLCGGAIRRGRLVFLSFLFSNIIILIWRSLYKYDTNLFISRSHLFADFVNSVGKKLMAAGFGKMLEDDWGLDVAADPIGGFRKKRMGNLRQDHPPSALLDEMMIEISHMFKVFRDTFNLNF